MNGKVSNPWLWVPTLFFYDAIPYITLTFLCLVFYKRTGLSHTEITCLGSLILLPWIIRPVVAESNFLRKHPRSLVIFSEFIIALGFTGLLYMTKGSWYKSITLLLFLIISCGYVVHNSATILFYKMLDTTTRQGFSHIKNTSHILGKLMTAGVLVMLVGGLETLSGKIAQSWSILFMILCGLFYAVLVYHVFTLPFGSQVREQMEYSTIKDRILTKKESLLASFKELTCQPKANTFLTFFLLYSIPHTFLLAITPLFLLDTPSHGGAGLSTQELGLCYGTIGLLGLTAGNIIGLKAIKEKRLENVIKTMSLCLSFPCLGYLLISLVGIEKFPLISAFVFLVEFGYGYGFTACTTFMERFCKGKPQYRVWCNIYITIGFILPGFITGYLQETLGYPIFFIIVIALGAISWSVTNNAIDSSR